MVLCKNKYHYFIYGRLSTIFRHLGCHVARNPKWYTFIPVIVTIFTLVGFFRIHLIRDIDYLFFRTDGRTTNAKLVIEELFPENVTDNDILRLTTMGKFGAIIATRKNGGSMLSNNIFEEINMLDQTVRDMEFEWKGRNINFTDICRKSEGKCIENHLLFLKYKIDIIKTGRFKIRYPYDIGHNSSEILLYGMGLGGVKIDEHDVVKEFQAIRLIYFLDYNNNTNYEIADLWEEKFLQLLNNMKFQNIRVSMFSGKTMENEFNNLTLYNLPLLFLAQFFMISFAVASCMTIDCVSSKPWIGFAGCTASTLGAIAAFGLLLLCGMMYVDQNIAIPFVVLGVGMDDSFVILSAWRKTDCNKDMVTRMGETYSDAAVSITVTTLTNIIASLVGLTTPYRTVHIISIYMAVSFLFAYIYQLTFFGGCLVYSGYRETKNLHAVWCTPIEWDKNSGFMRLITVGFTSQKENDINSPKWNFYRDELGRILSYKSVKLAVIITYIIYISFGIYFTRFIKCDINYNDLYYKNSYGSLYTDDDAKYFSVYRERIQIVLDEPLDYSDPTIQRKLEELTIKMENIPYIARNNLTESWLRIYLKLLKSPLSPFSFSGYNTSDPEEFIEGLQNVFLKFKFAKRFQRDIIFDSTGKNILASRFFLLSQHTDTAMKQANLLHKLYEIIDSSGLNIHVYSYELLFADSFVNVLPYIIRSICASSVLVIIVFFIIIPNILCICCIVITVLSIVTSVLGYTSVWDVNINAAIMLFITLIAGFCVDYASHISCAYACSKAKTPNGKMKDSLQAAAHPIMQGGISTLAAAFAVIFSSYRIFYDLFKIMFLVIVFSIFHGIFLLPVVLSIWDAIVFRFKNKSNNNSEQDSSIEPNVTAKFFGENDNL